MKESTEPKIDLEEIQGFYNAITNRVNRANESREIIITIPKGDAAKIAAALEALPKLVEALQYSNRMLKQASKRFGDDGFYDCDFINEALEPFTTKTQQQ